MLKINRNQIKIKTSSPQDRVNVNLSDIINAGDSYDYKFRKRNNRKFKKVFKL